MHLYKTNRTKSFYKSNMCVNQRPTIQNTVFDVFLLKYVKLKHTSIAEDVRNQMAVKL